MLQFFKNLFRRKPVSTATVPQEAKAASSNGEKQVITPEMLAEQDLVSEMKAIVLTEEEVAEVARQIWQSNGCPQGKDDDFWEEAEISVQRVKFKETLINVSLR